MSHDNNIVNLHGTRDAELSLMYYSLEMARKARGLPDLPGTCHLMRDADIERQCKGLAR